MKVVFRNTDLVFSRQLVTEEIKVIDYTSEDYEVGILQTVDGAVRSSISAFSTINDYIPLPELTVSLEIARMGYAVVDSLCCCCLYDENHQFISGASGSDGSTINLSDYPTAKFLKFSTKDIIGNGTITIRKY